MRDRVAKLHETHNRAVKYAQKWSEAAAKGHKTETLYRLYEKAEAQFDRAVAMLDKP